MLLVRPSQHFQAKLGNLEELGVGVLLEHAGESFSLLGFVEHLDHESCTLPDFTFFIACLLLHVGIPRIFALQNFLGEVERCRCNQGWLIFVELRLEHGQLKQVHRMGLDKSVTATELHHSLEKSQGTGSR